MADVDDEDYVYLGTPIEREEETSSRKRKVVAAEAGTLRSLPAWKQEVRDEEGRKRFHGAFTGGFSAGYYNSVGSKEGWTPQTFTSSRKSRAEVKKQSVYNFFDEDDLKDIGGNSLETSMQYDTFGFTAAEFARKKAEEEQKKRPSAIPGPAPDELVLPVSSSIGKKLLMKMGWRQGRSIKDSSAECLSGIRREARKALLAFPSEKTEPDLSDRDPVGTDEFPDMSIDDLSTSGNTPVYVLEPKQDMYGLGYDPFKHAPEFRDSKRLRESKSGEKNKSKMRMGGHLLSSNSGRYAPGFGIGALEELDVEDEDIYASGFDYELTEVEVEPSKAVRGSSGDNMLRLEHKKRNSLLGFKPASDFEYKLERFHPPAIPSNFRPIHKFSVPLDQTIKDYNNAPPTDASPPEDANLRLLIEGSAAMVARCGKSIEDVYMEKSKTNPLFSFLKSGAEGHDYYIRKLWEHKQKYVDELKQAEKLTAEKRGRILGERPLASTPGGKDVSVKPWEVINAQSNLGDTFTKPISLADIPESARKPFKHDPAKQERFEQFLKEKYQGGLRASGNISSSSSSSTMSEVDRARERLDFESAAEAIEKGKWNSQISAPSANHAKDLLGFGEDRFVSSTFIENQETKLEAPKAVYPKREQFEWRPSPILCKRFDLIDPYMGKPPPVPRPRSKMDSLIFLTETFKTSTREEPEPSVRDVLNSSKSNLKEELEPSSAEADVAPPSPKNVERPVDLYKAIFSDDSEDEVGDDGPSLNQAPDPVESSEGANKTLNRLVAGDFLSSLGKELGLEIPPDSRPGPSLNTNAAALREQKDPKDGDDTDNMALMKVENAKSKDHGSTVGSGTMALTKVEDTKSKNYDSTVNSSREKKGSHSRHHRSRTPDSYSDSDSDSSEGHKSRSSRRRDKKDKRRSSDSESGDDAYAYRKERRKRHHSRRHHKHKRKDYGDKYSDKKRRT